MSTEEDYIPIPLTDVLEKKLGPYSNKLKIIKNMVARIKKSGISIKDAATLERIDEQLIRDWSQTTPEIIQILEVARLEYKESLLSVVSEQATIAKDIKVALDLLSANFPQEFNKSVQREAEKKRAIDDTGNVLLDAINHIRQSNESPVQRPSTQSFTVETENPLLKKSINEILS